MSISVPPGQPSITETLGSAFRDGGALVKKNLVPAAILIALGTLAAIAVALSGRPPSAGLPAAFESLLLVIDLVLVVVGYCAIAAAVRTIHAEYRMTAGQFFGILGYSLLAGLLTTIAGIFFVIPAYWVGVKLMLTPYTYAVTNGAPGALKTTWNMTTGYYWQTVGMFLLLGLCVGAIVAIAVGIAVFGITSLPLTAIVLAPFALAVLTWLVHVQALAYVRWTSSLLPRANVPQGLAAVPA